MVNFIRIAAAILLVVGILLLTISLVTGNQNHTIIGLLLLIYGELQAQKVGWDEWKNPQTKKDTDNDS